VPSTGQETGKALGSEAFATLSDGTRIFHPGWYRKAERSLKTALAPGESAQEGQPAQAQSGAAAGGCRCWRVPLLGKAQQKVRRQRQDFHHKTALALVRQNDTIDHEPLQPANMVKHHHLAQSITDAGWGAFLIILTHKAACAGRRVVAVTPA
jgi:putative transposase